MFISMVDDGGVWFRFDDIMNFLINNDYQCVVKKFINDEIMFFNNDVVTVITNGDEIEYGRAATNHCYISLRGVFKLLNGVNVAVDDHIIKCLSKIENTDWIDAYKTRIENQIDQMFNVYFKTLKHYMLYGTRRDVSAVNFMITEAQKLRQSTNINMLLVSLKLFESATLMLCNNI
ncbi:PxORF8 peptide [Plutella xylostella granulovirus]|uniref:PxORF8 peptide n=1 Tax=Plutella xylostella granulovirus TaxID=98383 RepID=Q9JGU2_9BBAC|nr:PxORF8 peptide [Plutella xylostella granulovirus]AAG27306.1 PxORF8 peptide [Plutella xylostella granulovirus]